MEPAEGKRRVGSGQNDLPPGAVVTPHRSAFSEIMQICCGKLEITGTDVRPAGVANLGGRVMGPWSLFIVNVLIF